MTPGTQCHFCSLPTALNKETDETSRPSSELSCLQKLQLYLGVFPSLRYNLDVFWLKAESQVPASQRVQPSFPCKRMQGAHHQWEPVCAPGATYVVGEPIYTNPAKYTFHLALSGFVQ